MRCWRGWTRFHCLVMLAELGMQSADVLAELERRFDLSGIAEKAARQHTTRAD